MTRNCQNKSESNEKKSLNSKEKLIYTILIDLD